MSNTHTRLFLPLLIALSACSTANPTVDAITVTASSPSVQSGANQIVFADVTGSGAFDRGVTWAASAGAFVKTSGSVNTFTAPTVQSQTTVTLTATSSANAGVSGTATITINPIAMPSSISDLTVVSGSSTLNAATTTTLEATVTGTGAFANGVNWSIVSGAGTLSAPSGAGVVFTSPSVSVANRTIIRATSVQDPLRSATVTLNINATAPNSSVSAVTVNANPTSLNALGSSTLSAIVTGAGAFGDGINWSIVSGAGALSATTGANTVFTAPSLSGASATTIRASSAQDASKTADLTISIAAAAPSATITGVTINPSATTLNALASATLSATVSGSGAFGNALTWSIVSGAGNLSAATGPSVVFTAPSQSSASETIVRAQSVQDPTKSETVTLSINATAPNASVTAVTVSATATTLNALGSSTLSAVVTGTGAFGNGVNWSIVSGAGNLSSATGSSVTFTAPSAATPSATIVRATSLQDPTKSATVTLNINANSAGSSISGINVFASQVALREGGQSVLQGIVSGAGAFNQGLNWQIEAGGVGSLSGTTGGTVLYTAPSVSFGRVTRITATSVQDANVKQTVFLSVNPVKSSVAVGDLHMVALKTDGTLLSWGYDFFGQLGDGGPNADQATPVSVSGASNIVAVAVGGYHSLALKTDGTLLSWGSDNLGQLGDSSANINKSAPVAVIGASNIIAIAAGDEYSVALKSDGTLLSWGSDNLGQLGNGSANTSQATPVAVIGASNIVAIAAGDVHLLALKSDGTLLSTGDDSFGQLGNDGANTTQSVLAPVLTANNIIAISAGGGHSLALKSDGTLLSWGRDIDGELGDGGANTNQPSPVTVTGANNIIDIASGQGHSLALKSDGTLLSWGSDLRGQLGDGGANTNQSLPVAVSGASNIVAMDGGAVSSVALKSDGTLLSWGDRTFGQLGIGNTSGIQSTPVSVLLGALTIRLP